MSTDTAQAVAVATIPFTVASRSQSRFSNKQTIDVINGAASFAPIPLPATGHVRAVSILVETSAAFATAGALGGSDGPFSLINSIALTDATGQPVVQPISGFNAYLLQKYLSFGSFLSPEQADPTASPDYTYSATAVSGTAKFRLYLVFEQDYRTGYGCIPNLDANASLQLRIEAAGYGAAFAGTGVTAANTSVTVEQIYWAPVGTTTGGVPNAQYPPGYGDFLQTRYETQTVTAAAENTIPVNNRGGMVKGILLVSRAAGQRVAFNPTANLGIVYDNAAINEGVRFDNHNDIVRRLYGFNGPDRSAAANAFQSGTVGTTRGIDTGVAAIPFGLLSGGRDSWLSTRVGTLLQVKATPGAAATQLELVTALMQVRDAQAFYGR